MTMKYKYNNGNFSFIDMNLLKCKQLKTNSQNFMYMTGSQMI